MNETTKIQKICPSCHQTNKHTDSYCRSCGASLEGIEAVKKKDESVPISTETNKREITETLAGTKYCLNCCMLVIFIMVLVIMIYPLFVTPFGMISFVLLLITAFPITLCLFIQIYRFTSPMGPARTFSISDQQIKITFPKKSPFRISWSEFNTVQLYKYNPGYYAAFPVGFSLQAYKINFLSNNALVSETTIELGRDFKSSTAKKIRNLISQYAHRLNKEYIWGKNIQKVRRKRQKRQKR